MSFAVIFKPSGMTSAKYDDVMVKLNAAGAAAPKGREYHACYGNPSSLHVTDIWESMEDFDEFGQTLMPILLSLGIDPGQPEVQEIHNIVEG